MRPKTKYKPGESVAVLCTELYSYQDDDGRQTIQIATDLDDDGTHQIVVATDEPLAEGILIVTPTANTTFDDYTIWRTVNE